MLRLRTQEWMPPHDVLDKQEEANRESHIARKMSFAYEVECTKIPFMHTFYKRRPPFTDHKAGNFHRWYRYKGGRKAST